MRASSLEAKVWTFLARSRPPPELWLLAGRDDRYHAWHQTLAGLLPPDHVTFIPGAHTWYTWTALWREFCQTTEIFPRRRPSDLYATSRSR